MKFDSLSVLCPILFPILFVATIVFMVVYPTRRLSADDLATTMSGILRPIVALGVLVEVIAVGLAISQGVVFPVIATPFVMALAYFLSIAIFAIQLHLVLVRDRRDGKTEITSEVADWLGRTRRLQGLMSRFSGVSFSDK
ncbi:MAG: hypothetical protein N2C14_13725 [Planctomycetales bacterium]